MAQARTLGARMDTLIGCPGASIRTTFRKVFG